MTSLTAEQSGAVQTHARALTVEVFFDLAGVEPIWRALEANGVFTPYQRFEWMAGVLASGAERDRPIAVAVILQRGEPVALLPLIVEKRPGLALGRLVGSSIANSDWLLCRRGFLPDAADMQTIFKAVGRQARLDLLAFYNLPQAWQGMDNPLLLAGAAPAASNSYFATIGPSELPYIEHRLATKRRSNIKRGERRLEELLGPVRLVRAEDEASFVAIHQAFLAQRGARFDEMGIGNVFAEPEFRQIFRTLVLQGFGSARPPMAAHALYAGEEIVATSWGVYGGEHYSQYINSTSAGPAGKYSLSGILVGHLMDELVSSGILTFDMGVGDFEYKQDWTEPMALWNAMVPVSFRGRIAAPAMRLGQTIKRAIKQNERLWALAQKVRLMLHKLRRG